jgi:hypothetical protein
MSYKIDPSGYCSREGCTRPKAAGEQVCSQCSRLARAAGGSEIGSAGPDTAAASGREPSPAIEEFLGDESRPPRCIAYLSISGDVITLELTGEPKFTEADIEAIANLLSNRNERASS